MHIIYIYIKCNTNVRRGEFGEVVVWKGEYHAYTSRGMERHAPRKWGQGLRGNAGSGEAPVFDGGVFPGARRGVWFRESFQGSPGVEKGWNGMEWSRA